MELAFYQPDIPQNVGTLIRLCACLGVRAHIIEPCGFAFATKGFRRASLDYAELADIRQHASWTQFNRWRKKEKVRLVLLSTRALVPYTNCVFHKKDIVMIGRETAGVPKIVFESCDVRLRIPMRSGLRSLNVATAAAMVIGEGLRQTNSFLP